MGGAGDEAKNPSPSQVWPSQSLFFWHEYIETDFELAELKGNHVCSDWVSQMKGCGFKALLSAGNILPLSDRPIMRQKKQKGAYKLVSSLHGWVGLRPHRVEDGTTTFLSDSLNTDSINQHRATARAHHQHWLSWLRLLFKTVHTCCLPGKNHVTSLCPQPWVVGLLCWCD